MAWRATFHTRRNPSLVGFFLLASMTGCGGDSPLPTEPDPCLADLSRSAGRWAGMAGDVSITMRLVPTRVSRSLFGFSYTVAAIVGEAVADHPDDSRDVTLRMELHCDSGLITSTVVAKAPPSQPGAPSPFAYEVARLQVVSVSATRLVADLVPTWTVPDLPNPFDAGARIVFERLPF